MRFEPPFRADHVGSYLRPERLKNARQDFQADRIGADDLREIEDLCILDIIQRQQDVGLKGITDGEFRRMFFHLDFLEKLKGVQVHHGTFSTKFRRDDGTELEFEPPTMHIVDRLEHVGPIQGPDFDFLAAHVSETPKVCIPSPSMLHFRGGRDAISREFYEDLDKFFEDLAEAYRAEIKDLESRGCRYLQMDDTNLAFLCDPDIRQSVSDRGDNPDELAKIYCDLINLSLGDKSDELVTTIHLCRGNFKSAWVAQGGYEPVAEILFNELNVDGYFLEFDNERSGDFGPLRFVPGDKSIILGLMSSKKPEIEDADGLKRRIEHAGDFISLDQCGLSHQCGFSSTEHGNSISEDDQWRKLERCVAVAEQVWG